ncbi:MAG: hypothetical protein R2880_08625 [Deinococcales bacterium]
MSDGTQVQVVYPDLVSVMAVARVQGGQLVFEGQLQAGREVRLLISNPHTGELLMPTAFVSPQGNDLLMNIPDYGLMPFSMWLAQTRSIKMILPTAIAAR